MADNEEQLTDKRRYNFFIIDNEVADNADLTPYEFRVYAQIVRYAGNERTAWPGHKKLAETCNMSRSTVIRAITTLEEKGLLGVERNSTSGSVNTYYVRHVSKGGVSQVHRGVCHRETLRIHSLLRHKILCHHLTVMTVSQNLTRLIVLLLRP
jgi:DNA-binding MarR family transcriptional regulator